MSTPPGERHHVPQPSSQALVEGTAQPKGTSQFLSSNGIYAPLMGLNPNDVLQGGYGFLDWTDGGVTPHPGYDLNSGSGGNADCGVPVCAPVSCVVEAVLLWDGYTSGEGNHLWLSTADDRCIYPAWVHYDHLQAIHVRQGQLVQAGEVVGECGRTGGWDYCHLHMELSKARPSSWWKWPYGWSKSQVQADYYDPYQWFWQTVIKAGEMGGGGVPPEAIAVLSDWEWRNWIMPDLWAWNNVPYNPESGTAQAWVNALRAGKYLGRPRTEERRYGEGDGAGVWVEHDYGVLVFRFSDGQASWTG